MSSVFPRIRSPRFQTLITLPVSYSTVNRKLYQYLLFNVNKAGGKQNITETLFYRAYNYDYPLGFHSVTMPCIFGLTVQLKNKRTV